MHFEKSRAQVKGTSERTFCTILNIVYYLVVSTADESAVKKT